MTGLSQSTWAAELPEPGEVSDFVEPTQRSEPHRRRSRRFIDGWRGAGWLAGGIAGGLAIAWFIFLGPGEIGSKAEWFFGAVVFVAVLVTTWQIHNVARHAKRDAAEAAERLRNELAAAEERSGRELALTQALHRAEMEAQQDLHRAAMELNGNWPVSSACTYSSSYRSKR